MIGKRSSGWAVLAAVLALLASCSTTAKHPSSSGGTSGGLSSSAGGTSAGAGSTDTTGGTNTTGPGGTGAATSSGGASSGSVGNLSGGALAAQPTPGAPVQSHLVAANAPGITASKIYVGIAYSSNEGAGDKAVGAAGAAPSYDYRNVFNAVTAFANKHGGFAGRQLQPYYFDYNVTSDTTTQDQAACAFWTQDHKIFATPGTDDILSSCIEKEGGVGIFAGGATESTYKQFPHLIDPTGITLERLASVTVAGLQKAKYFTGKLGLVTWDYPNYRQSITQGYLPALSALHITPAQVAYIMVPTQLGAVGDMSAAVASAVTKFRSLGIDHVIVQDGPAGVWGGTGLTLEWMDQAKSQQYYPRYGQNPYNSPGWSVLPADEMNKAIAVSFNDYDSSFDQGWHANVARDQCFKIEADAGYPVAAGNANDEVAAGESCDFVFFLQRVINGLSSVTNNSFVSAGEGLGTSFPSAVVYGTKFVSGRRDGADLFRNEEYLQSCTCLQFQGAPYYPD